MLLFSAMTLRQFSLFPDWKDPLGCLRWFLITVLFLQFLAAYIVRTRALRRAESLLDVLLPFTCAGLPFLVIMAPYWLWNALESSPYLSTWKTLQYLYFPAQPLFGFSTMALGEMITVWGMLGLKGSFSIATEVRVLRTKGPYRWVRHPLYSGEMLSLMGWSIYYCNLWNLLGCSLFIILQVWRAKREEAKLISVYPEYQHYRQQVGFLFPHILKR